MTNDDKLRDVERLREIAFEMKRSVEALRAVGCDDARLIDGNDRIANYLYSIAGRMLNEPTSPAPAAAPIDALLHILDRAKALRGTVDGWPKLIEEIEAMAAKAPTPVTSEAIEAAITALRISAHRVGVSVFAPDLGERDDELRADEAAAEKSLRALIARRVQQATAAAEELARAAESAVLMMSTKNSGNLRAALAAFRAAQGGGK